MEMVGNPYGYLWQRSQWGTHRIPVLHAIHADMLWRKRSKKMETAVPFFLWTPSHSVTSWYLLVMKTTCPVGQIELRAFLTLPVTPSTLWDWAQGLLFPESLCSSWRYHDHKKHKWQNQCKNKTKLNHGVFSKFWLTQPNICKTLVTRPTKNTCCLRSATWF